MYAHDPLISSDLLDLFVPRVRTTVTKSRLQSLCLHRSLFMEWISPSLCFTILLWGEDCRAYCIDVFPEIIYASVCQLKIFLFIWATSYWWFCDKHFINDLISAITYIVFNRIWHLF